MGQHQLHYMHIHDPIYHSPFVLSIIYSLSPELREPPVYCNIYIPRISCVEVGDLEGVDGELAGPLWRDDAAPADECHQKDFVYTTIHSDIVQRGQWEVKHKLHGNSHILTSIFQGSECLDMEHFIDFYYYTLFLCCGVTTKLITL